MSKPSKPLKKPNPIHIAYWDITGTFDLEVESPDGRMSAKYENITPAQLEDLDRQINAALTQHWRDKDNT